LGRVRRIRGQDGLLSAGRGALTISAFRRSSIMPRTVLSITSLTTACLAAACFAPPVLAQGAIKPVEALIVNPPSRPVPVQVLNAPMPAGEGSFELYNVEVTAPAGACNSASRALTVPAGKRLVLRHVGVSGVLPSPAALTGISIKLVTNGTISSQVLTVPAAAPLALAGGQFYSAQAGQQVHAYIDGAFTICISTTQITGDNLPVSLHGYLIAKP
jgi:hypothetical protein